MDDLTGHVAHSSSVKINLKNMVKDLFKENSDVTSDKGILRWNLHKAALAHPPSTLTLIKHLIKKIAKLQTCPCNMNIIAIFLTLDYVVLQSPVKIPAMLLQALYGCLTRLLILPQPHCALALRILKNVRTELFTPGSLYHRKVIAEQCLKNDHLKLQERVFLLADPKLEATIRANLKACSFLKDPLVQKRNAVLRLLQFGLGSNCHSPTLQQALECLGEQSVEDFFQETVLAVEQSVQKGLEGWRSYINSLQKIYDSILTSSDKKTGDEDNNVYPITMPYPEIHFIPWNDEEDLWDALTSFSNDMDLGSRRSSVQSMEEKKLKDYDHDPPQSPQMIKSSLNKRRYAYKATKPGNQLSLMNAKMQNSTNNFSSREQCRHTARVIVMGDDCILGKLASAYHSIRQKESKRVMLTNKLNLHFYYIPVTDLAPLQPDASVQEETKLSIASYLGKVDSWYDVNINNLQTAILKTTERQHMRNNRAPEQDLFFLDTLTYYLRCGSQKVNLPLYKVMLTKCIDGVISTVEEVFVSSLEADVTDFRHLKDKQTKLTRRKRSIEVFGGLMSVSYTQSLVSKRELPRGLCTMAYSAVINSEPSITHGEECLGVRFSSVNPEENTKIFTKAINIKAMENRTLSVCLDKDVHRTHINIQRIEVSSCVDPGCNLRRFSLTRAKDLPLTKYVDKILSLPINTFSGVTD
ncbi:hypothetical protein WMY93_003577 [Mugilogobius chulae]|uniref:Phosphoinositide 3-kinase regulatory subunit 6 n=1 Tax=Mugilogobius chulae TaxID=88201 RepID=A0AAW0QC10_9GOBI